MQNVGSHTIANAESSWLLLAQVKTLLSDQPALQQRYSDTLLDSYVDDNKRVKWCGLFQLHAVHLAYLSSWICYGNNGACAREHMHSSISQLCF